MRQVLELGDGVILARVDWAMRIKGAGSVSYSGFGFGQRHEYSGQFSMPELLRTMCDFLQNKYSEQKDLKNAKTHYGAGH